MRLSGKLSTAVTVISWVPATMIILLTDIILL